MEISYRYNSNGSSMILSGIAPEDIDSFSMKMLRKNSVPGLIEFRWEEVNGSGNLIYDVTSRQSLGRSLEYSKVREKDVRALVESLTDLAERLNEYLLDINGIMLDAELIYTDPERKHYYFCFNPAEKRNISKDIQNLMDLLVSSVDYDDRAGVKLVYELGEKSRKENFSISSLKDIHFSSEQDEPLSIRKIFNEQTENPDFDFAELSGSLEKEEGPDPSLYVRTSEDSEEELKFSDKLKLYFSRKKLKEIVEDINDGVLFREIKRCRPDAGYKPLEKAEAVQSEKNVQEADIPGIISRRFDVNSMILQTEGTARLSVRSGKRRLIGLGKSRNDAAEITKYPFTIGKMAGSADFVIDSISVSRIHAVIDRSAEGESWFIEDQNSTNGTFRNGRRLNAYTREEIAPGDILAFSEEEYVFR